MSDTVNTSEDIIRRIKNGEKPADIACDLDITEVTVLEEVESYKRSMMAH